MSGETKYCKNCGEQIDKECIICPKCGKQVEKIESLAADKNIIINNNNNAVTQNNGYGRYGKPKNKIAYCLLTLFLGGIGIHKFYAGKIGMGILYILFCWTGIPAFISFFEFIIALFKKADENGNIWL